MFCLIGVITLVQIVPIQINPWSYIMGLIRTSLVGDLEKQVADLTKDMLDEKVNNKRWNILDFANTCRQGRRHTKEEWEHCLEELSWYESYCERHNIPNGVMEETSKYLRGLYQKILHENDFL